ncbi:MAG: energy-coupling factor ABC transporter permease [Clostridia bacterium]|nr:energy-coupling factor ABC transporter permease [Clostridia bacterium]
MAKNHRLLVSISIAFSLVFGFVETVGAMHITEGYLPLKYCVLWSVVCIPFLTIGVLSIKKIVDKNRKTLMILVMMGAYAFVLSALKIPSVTGSSSHPTGTGLGAILFGPSAMCAIGIIVLLFQAILLAHGGLTTLGANTFSMGIAGPFAAYGIYFICKKINVPKSAGIFLAAGISDLFTYCITAFQLALAHPSPVGGFRASLIEFLGIFAVTQIPLAIIEGLLAVVVMKGLEAYAKPELTELSYFDGGQ